MGMDAVSCGCVLLAGGRGSRMGGTNKALLQVGGESFAARIHAELKRLGLPCYLSLAGYGETAAESGLRDCIPVFDRIATADGGLAGPLGGIISCLEESWLDALFFVPCDMPDFRAEMAEILLDRWEKSGCACAVWQTRDGRLHPTCGVYARECLAALKAAAAAGQYRLRDVLAGLSCLVLRTSDAHLPDRWFENINDPDALTRYRSRTGAAAAAGDDAAGVLRPVESPSKKKSVGQEPTTPVQPVLAVSGLKNTGKTGLLERIIHGLTERGIRTAVIKHDAHAFEPDVPGTDSYRLKQAGALGTAIFSRDKYCIVKDEYEPETAFFFRFFPEADIILLEGHKTTPYRKIEVMRDCISREPVCDPETVIAYVSDRLREGETGILNGKPVYPFEDQAHILETVLAVIDGRLPTAGGEAGL